MKATNVSWQAPAVALAAAVVWASLAVSAAEKGSPSDFNDRAATVIAHVRLEGAPASEMFLQDRAGRQYLYINQGPDQGYTVVDITRPAHPTVRKRVHEGKLDMLQGGLGISESPDADSSGDGGSRPKSESITILDLSDPTNPRTVQTFKGVTSVLADQKRDLFFIANADGLWVVRNNLSRLAPSRTLPPCSSESAIQAMPPDCQ